MVFSSMLFLWLFFPIVIGGNFLLGLLPLTNEKKICVKNIFLLIASLAFYAWGGIYYVFIMVGSILLNYTAGRILEEKCSSKGQRKMTVAIAVVLNLLLLFYFKYFNMFILVIEAITEEGSSLHSIIAHMSRMTRTGAILVKEVVLPIGISFFTFQSMSYVIDVYRGKAPLQKNILYFGLYVALFPQLIAGPIVKYNEVAKDINERKESLDLFFSGQKRFAYGLAKKVLLANTFGKASVLIWSLDFNSLGPAMAWFGIFVYALQIYYDFSGYSDMAIGIGRMLGFHFQENFNYPFTATSIRDLWRRWHISLNTWFTEYVYIPLGGNRKGKVRTYINLLLVFLLTGMWHGANFTFIAWGMYHGILLVLERLWFGKILDKNPVKPLNVIWVFFNFCVSLVFFRADNFADAKFYLGQMFSHSEAKYSFATVLNMELIVALIFGVLFCGVVQRPLAKIWKRAAQKRAVQVLDVTLQLVLVAYSIFVLVCGSFNPFLYFRF